ncbi:MAG: coagulation factor 5/8 type protein, partial [Polaromonas sp.]|nr:coagulation factor 5/8 type protein [Polaromonas sp.]
YQYSSPQTFSRVVFQEGRHFTDGGWFASLTVQVRQAGAWVNVPGLGIAPAYPGVNNNVGYETYTLQFSPTSGDAIRIHGVPGGSAAFVSVAELRVYSP